MKTTEAESYYSNLEQMSVLELLSNINKEEEKTKVEKDYQKEATNAKVRAKRVRDREKIYKDILKKIGTGELKTKDYDKLRKLGLNPDEIKIKLNQIMDLS